MRFYGMPRQSVEEGLRPTLYAHASKSTTPGISSFYASSALYGQLRSQDPGCPATLKLVAPAGPFCRFLAARTRVRPKVFAGIPLTKPGSFSGILC